MKSRLSIIALLYTSTYVVITLYIFYIRILTLYSCLDFLKYYHFITFLIQSLYLFMSHERTCCQWLILSQEHGSKFNISLSSQKEIQLVEISQRLFVAISLNTINYCIMSFLAFSQNFQSIQQLHCLFLGHQVCWNSLHFDPNCKDCRHRIWVGKNGVSLTTNLVLWISSNHFDSEFHTSCDSHLQSLSGGKTGGRWCSKWHNTRDHIPWQWWPNNW